MDKLSEHAIRMLEIVDKPYHNEYGMINKDLQDKHDIARAIYDLILQVQMLKEVNRKKSCSEKPNNCEELNAYRECVKSRSFWDNKHCDGCYFDERCPFDEPQTKALFTDKDGDVWEWRGDSWYCISGDEPQTERSE